MYRIDVGRKNLTIIQSISKKNMIVFNQIVVVLLRNMVEYTVSGNGSHANNHIFHLALATVFAILANTMSVIAHSP